MSRSWWWKPSEIPAGDHVVARCTRADCAGFRYLPRAYLIEKAGDIPLHDIQPRLRCVEPPRLDRRGKPCRAAMELDWLPTPDNNRPSAEMRDG